MGEVTAGLKQVMEKLALPAENSTLNQGWLRLSGLESVKYGIGERFSSRSTGCGDGSNNWGIQSERFKARPDHTADNQIGLKKGFCFALKRGQNKESSKRYMI